MENDIELTRAVRELAHRLGGVDELAVECGVKPCAVVAWMNGERSPSLHMRFVLDVIAQRVGMIGEMIPRGEGRTPPPSHRSGVRRRLGASTKTPHEGGACGAFAGAARGRARGE